MVLSNKAMFDPIRSVAFGAITNAFLPLGDPLEGPASAILFNNLTDAMIQISYNGTDVNQQFPAGFGIAIPFTQGGYDSATLYLPANTQMYIRYLGAAPTTESFWVEIIRPQLV